LKRNTLTGTALILGGLTYLIANTVLTLMMPMGEDWTLMFASDAFLARLSVAASSVFFLLVGAIGLYNRQAAKLSLFGKTAFGILFIGSMFLFAHEWAQVFFLHTLAQIDPEALMALENVEGTVNFYDIEAILAVTGFLLGWLLFSISMLMARIIKPIGPIILLAGFFITPALAVALPELWGFVIGNSFTAFGWVLIGRDMMRPLPD